jgi:drug/metabolite transporter (DMT)-like permease
MQFFGFLIILSASFALAMSDVKKLKISKALIPVLWVVLISDIVIIMTKYVYERVEFYPAFMFFAAGLGLAGAYLSLRVFYERSKHDLSLFKRNLVKLVPVLAVVELLGVAAEFTTNLAMSRGPVSLVNVLEGVQPIFVLLIAVIFFPVAPHLFREASEGKLTKKFTCMTIILAGLAIIWASV